MVAKEQRPLAGGRDFRGLLQDFSDGLAVFQLQPHEHPGHQREMKRHVEFIAVAEIWAKIGGPLIGLGQQHPARELFIEFFSQVLQNFVGLGQILTIRTFAFDEVWNRVQAEGVNAHFQPELHHIPHLFPNRVVVVVEIGLVTEEAVPIEGFRNRVPGPVGRLSIKKDDAGARVAAVGITPDVPIAARIVLRTSRLLKPGMLIRGVIQDHFDDDPDAPLVGRVEKLPEILQCSVAGMDGVVIGDVVAVVAQRRGEEGHEPNRVDPQFLKVVELCFKPLEIADAISVAVMESADVDLIDERVLVPEHIPV